jgi:type IV fimbrial biogenesis protein FimT
VLVASAAPAVNSIGTSMKLSSFSNSFVSLMQMARGEAIKRNSRVVVCKSAEGISCTPVGGWEQGWIVFHDRNNNGARDTGETLIGRVQALPQPYRMSGNQSVARYISFSPDGSTRLTSGAFQAGTVTVCRQSADRAEARQVII